MQREPELKIGAKPFGALWGPSPLSGYHAKGFPYAPTTGSAFHRGPNRGGGFSIRRRWVMPSLRELFEKIPSNHIHAESYAFLAALLEVVELQECPQGCDTIIRKLRSRIRALEALLPRYKSDTAAADSTEPEDTDATIRKLRDERDTWERRCKEAERDLREARNYWKRRSRNVERQLTKAKAEIERLRKDPFDEFVLVRCQNAERARDRLIDEHDRLKADAEIGRLVQRMPCGSSLSHPGFVEGWVYLDYARRHQGDTPAEALAAIQEAKEHKCE